MIKKSFNREVMVVTARECASAVSTVEEPHQAAAYWTVNVASARTFNPGVETAVVLILNTRRRVTGHCLVGQGLLNTVLMHPREVFRAAVALNAHAVIVMHNHPSGDPSPSRDDIRATRYLIGAGNILGIELLDHVIVAGGRGPGHCSLKALGYFEPVKRRKRS